MTSTLIKALERALLCAVCFVVVSLFFIAYRAQYKAEIAERVTREFLYSISASGTLDTMDYENYLLQLAEIGGFSAELSHTTYGKEPFYGYYAVEDIDEYYAARNKRESHPVTSEVPSVDVVDVDKLFMKKESNASVLAGLLNDVTVAIPVEGISQGLSYKAISPIQEGYVGEMLTTMLLVNRDGVVYYCMGDDVAAPYEGTYTVPIKLNGVDTGETIQLTAWQRETTCSNGHTYPCTLEVIDRYKQSGKWELCPYCSVMVSDMKLEPIESSVALGTPIEELSVSVRVTYGDGSDEILPLERVANDYLKDYAGAQNITVSYKGVTMEVGKIVTEEARCVDCANTVGQRNFTDYSQEKRCAACLQGMKLYLGECFDVANTKGQSQLVEVLQDEPAYNMKRGDYLVLTVYKTGRMEGVKFFPSADTNTYFRMGTVIRGSAP